MRIVIFTLMVVFSGPAFADTTNSHIVNTVLATTGIKNCPNTKNIPNTCNIIIGQDAKLPPEGTSNFLNIGNFYCADMLKNKRVECSSVLKK